MFSASTGNFNDDDFIKLWEIIGKTVLNRLKSADKDETGDGRKITFRIEAVKL
jgi:hypothetical protein